MELDGVLAKGANLGDTWVARTILVEGGVYSARRVSRRGSSEVKFLNHYIKFRQRTAVK